MMWILELPRCSTMYSKNVDLVTRFEHACDQASRVHWECIESYSVTKLKPWHSKGTAGFMTINKCGWFEHACVPTLHCTGFPHCTVLD